MKKHLFLAVFLSWSFITGILANPVIDNLESDADRVRQWIAEGDLDHAWLESCSALNAWKDHADFLDFTDKIQSIYGTLAEPVARELLEARMELLSSTSEGSLCIDIGLLAVNLPKQASKGRRAFETALLDPAYSANPFVHALLARAWLQSYRVKQATAEYEAAIELAEELDDPAILFRLRQLYADDLFDKYRMEPAIKAAYLCEESTYPLEKAWFLSQKVLYYQSQEDEETAMEAFAELKYLMPIVFPRSDLDWQRRKYEDIVETVEMVDRSLAEDPVAQMAFDVEMMDYEYKTGGILRGGERLKRWVERYPIENYSNWTDPRLKEWVPWAYLNYYVSISLDEWRDEANAAFRHALRYVPFERKPDQVMALRAWLVHNLMIQYEYEEAQEEMDAALMLDVSHLDGRNPLLPIDTHQTRVDGALSDPPLRKAIIDWQRNLERRLEKERGGQ